MGHCFKIVILKSMVWSMMWYWKLNKSIGLRQIYTFMNKISIKQFHLESFVCKG